jgi:hypothetical protein
MTVSSWFVQELRSYSLVWGHKVLLASTSKHSALTQWVPWGQRAGASSWRLTSSSVLASPFYRHQIQNQVKLDKSRNVLWHTVACSISILLLSILLSERQQQHSKPHSRLVAKGISCPLGPMGFNTISASKGKLIFYYGVVRRPVNWLLEANVAASIFRAEHAHSTLPRNVAFYQAVHTAPKATRTSSQSSPPWKPQMSQITICISCFLTQASLFCTRTVTTAKSVTVVVSLHEDYVGYTRRHGN